jgi:predicted MFS family arabinose efflux permease
MLTAGVLYAADPALPFLVGGTVNAAGVAVLLTMPRVDPGDDDGGLSVRRAVSIVRSQLFQPGVRPVVLGMALFTGCVGVADTYIQPVAVDVVGLPTATLGPLYAGFAAVAAVASYRADAVEARLGSRRALFVLGGAVGAALALPLAAAALALPAFFLMKAVRRALSPVVGGYVNDNVDSVGRATTLSAAAMLYGLVGFVLKPASGVVADAVGPVPTVAAVGALLVAGMVALRAFGEPADAPSEGSAPT